MKTNISSQIKLDRIPKKYYAPEGEIEFASITREEKVYTKIFESSNEGLRNIAEDIALVINRCKDDHRQCVLALGTGAGTAEVYAELIKMYKEQKVSFSNVIVFNMFEFFPLSDDAPSSLKRLKNLLLDHVDINPDNINSPNVQVSKEDVYQYCKEYEAQIEACGGIDLAMCEIGIQGTLGFNEPGTQLSSSCRLVLLNNESRHIATAIYNNNEKVPSTAITLGISNLLGAKRIIAFAMGENKAKIACKTIEAPMSDKVPASFLQMHRHAKIVLDLSAAEALTRISHPWKVTSCEWNDKLVRRAIVWLCAETKKPILKLTNKDYNDFGLSELLAIYGSAYNVNIKVFNDIQHTITGWPGGKPDADDTYRPERAKPFPKDILIFSPHPDDDVISMGGTFRRLVDQKHNVHIAYETSGNIAVGDEDMMRYIMLNDNIASHFGFETEEFLKRSAEIHKFLATKKDGDSDSADIRYIKTIIRQGEARTACHYMGVKPENVHFLNLPFYETGTIKKGDLSRADVDIVKKLILEVKPDQMFVAGDLADPHGTHRVCLDAVLAAVDEIKDEEFMKNCRIWMYRGAWAEWEMDHIEMAVPLSPEELRQKRNSILKHQSQMENAPFLGDDERLFWQRAEDRNIATAELYSSLGLASYEAIEAFVQYHPIRDNE